MGLMGNSQHCFPFGTRLPITARSLLSRALCLHSPLWHPPALHYLLWHQWYVLLLDPPTAESLRERRDVTERITPKISPVFKSWLPILCMDLIQLLVQPAFCSPRIRVFIPPQVVELLFHWYTHLVQAAAGAVRLQLRHVL